MFLLYGNVADYMKAVTEWIEICPELLHSVHTKKEPLVILYSATVPWWEQSLLIAYSVDLL